MPTLPFGIRSQSRRYSYPTRPEGEHVALARLSAHDVMSAREVAALMHAPVSTVEDWARRGLLPSVKVGRRRLYIRANIEVVLLGQSDAQPSP